MKAIVIHPSRNSSQEFIAADISEMHDELTVNIVIRKIHTNDESRLTLTELECNELEQFLSDRRRAMQNEHAADELDEVEGVPF